MQPFEPTPANIRHLRGFVFVARHKSFTKASLDLRVSQPALTMAIRQLEDIVGARLFDRTTRAVQLTPEARDLLPMAERLLADFDDLMRDIRASARQRQNRVSLASVHSVATKLLPGVVAALGIEEPAVRVRIRDGNSSDVRRRVERDEVDFGIGSKLSEEPELEFVQLFRDQLGLLLPKGHRFVEDNVPVTWDELNAEVFVGLSSDTATAPLLGNVPNLPESVLFPRHEVSTNSTLWALVEGGVGITTTPALSAPHPQSSLTFCRLISPTVWREVYVVKRRGRSLTTASTKMIAMIRKALEEHSDDDLICECREGDFSGTPRRL